VAIDMPVLTSRRKLSEEVIAEVKAAKIAKDAARK